MQENMDAYFEFIKGIDIILMGWNTYHQVVTEPRSGVLAEIERCRRKDEDKFNDCGRSFGK